ncbi:SET domain-containing protein [Rhodopseudomonas palustris]|uniref:SET domain-containing protein n=1 Tax=Rhodopseudomonas palustris TaxID=1076 RepID=UPI000D1BC182|nr:SET domain-containing protein [Rhodopseudomonas palustris]AVT82776.1 SET domain-containing protein-lysine N-methyltransferase [Rhodopseudomonas palustris]
MPLLSNDHYRVGRSKTGLGLFAVKPIKKGAKIIRYFGPLLDAHNKKHDGIENKYLFELNKRWTIDGSVRKNVARYINHACKPNAESDVNPRKKRVIIRAIKNIEPGEEINYDYGTDYFKAYLKPIGCKCVSCEKKRKKKAAEARAEKAKLKLKAERKAQAEAEKAARKAAKAAGKTKPEKPSKPEKVAKSKAPKAVKATATATTKGAGKAANTKVVTAKAGKTKAAKPAKTTSSRKTTAGKSKAA